MRHICLSSLNMLRSGWAGANFMVKVWPKFAKVLLENGVATRHATSFPLGNRYEVDVAAVVLHKICPVLRNTPPARSGQIWAGTAFSCHIYQIDVMYRTPKAPNMLSRSLWRDTSCYSVMFALIVHLISCIFPPCLLFWWSNIEGN